MSLRKDATVKITIRDEAHRLFEAARGLGIGDLVDVDFPQDEDEDRTASLQVRLGEQKCDVSLLLKLGLDLTGHAGEFWLTISTDEATASVPLIHPYDPAKPSLMVNTAKVAAELHQRLDQIEHIARRGWDPS